MLSVSETSAARGFYGLKAYNPGNKPINGCTAWMRCFTLGGITLQHEMQHIELVQI